MVGRSSRRFGQCSGRVYVIAPMASQDIRVGGQKLLMDRSKKTIADEGVRIARMLTNKLPQILHDQTRQKLVEAFGKPPVWRTTISSFSAVPAHHRFFKEEKYTATRNGWSQ